MTSNSPRSGFAGRLAAARPMLLDGATGSELERRGVPMDLPLWGALAAIEHPARLRAVHASYARLGVEAVCANTFRTFPHTLAKVGRAAEAAGLTAESVALARASGAPWVLGSQPPVEDCWHPERAPAEPVLRAEHGAHARALAAAGCDGILVETHNSLDEARIALAAARATGLPVLAGFSLDEGGRLRSGEAPGAAYEGLLADGARGCILNCTAPAVIDGFLPELVRLAGERPVWVYANHGYLEGGAWRPATGREDAFAADCLRWIAAGARGVGGCCGSGPAEIRALARRWGEVDGGRDP